MVKIKEVNRNVKFDSRQPDSKYRCKYGNRSDFDILRINITLNNYTETYEIEAQFLPEKNSIHFNARPSRNGFEVYDWTKAVAKHIRKVEN